MSYTRKVSCFTKDGAFVREFDSMKEAGSFATVSPENITKAISRNGAAGGYRWGRKEQDIPESKASTKRGVSVTEFREKHDVMIILRKGVRNLRKGELLTIAEFAHDLKLPGGVGYKDKLLLDEFEPYRGRVTANDVRWGHPDDIAELKRDRLLK